MQNYRHIQELIEQEAKTLAIDKAAEILSQHIEAGTEYNTSIGRKALLTILPVIRAHFAECIQTKSRHKNDFIKYTLATLDDTVVVELADLTAVMAVSSMSTESVMMTAVRSIAETLHKHLRMDYSTAEVLGSTMKFIFGVFLEVEDKTGVFTCTRAHTHDNYTLELSEEWKELAEEQLINEQDHRHIFWPMVYKPNPHFNLFGKCGGYLVEHSPLLKRKVKLADGSVPSMLTDFNALSNKEFFDEINRTQETAYCVNKKFLDLVMNYYPFDYYIKDFPSEMTHLDSYIEAEARREIDFLNKQNEERGYSPITTRYERKIYRDCTKKAREQVRKTEHITAMACRFAEFPAIYFPVYLDSRGRRYPYVPSSSLSYIGTSYAKAMLEFADKKAFTFRGIKELFYTLGAALGYDKKSRLVRGRKAVEWWNKYKHYFMSGMYDVIFHTQDEMDDPCNVIAIVLELVEFKKDKNYKSGYIAHRDARCSGPSIIGTMLNDENAMKLTSVFDSTGDDLPDGYTEAAKTGRAINTDPYFEQHAGICFSRSMWKTPTMVVSSYGGKQHGVAGFAEHTGRPEKGTSLELFNNELDVSKANDLAGLMMKAIYQTLPSCKMDMDEFLKVARVALKRDGAIMFHQPLSGFPVVRRKNKKEKDTVVAPSYYPRKELVFYNYTTKLDTAKTLSSSVPDKTHSFDGAIVHQMGVRFNRPLACVHDSFGCHPNDAKELVQTYADLMYDIATGDYLQQVYDQLKPGSTAPFIGTRIDLHHIKTSQHILC